MHFAQAAEGAYRIYAGAIEPARGGEGFTAAVVVRRVLGGVERDAWRDDLLAGGHRWPRPEDALQYALRAGREAVRRQTALSC